MGDIVVKSKLTKDEMSIIIENSLVDYLKIVSKNGDRPFILDKKIGWVRTFPTAWSNYIFYSNFDDNEITDQVSQVITGIRSGELPDEWLVGPKSRPLNLCDYLENNDFKKQYDMAGMAINLTKLDTTISIPDGINVVTVDNILMIKSWVDVVSKGLWNGNTFEACLFKDLIHDSKCKFYLAFLNGEPVATSMLLLSKKIASIDMVATLKEHRGMGIGTVMTLIPLLYARDNGYKIGVLQASAAGEPVYRKIGFEEYCRFNVYKYQKVSNCNETNKHN